VRRREFIALTGASVAGPFVALAQEPGRTYRLGGLFPAPRDNPATRLSSPNCDASVSSKAKTLRSNIALMGNTSICFRKMQPS
jgi:hypothetical protein